MDEPHADYFGDIGGNLGQTKDGGLDACDVECLGGERWGWGCFVAVQGGNGGGHCAVSSIGQSMRLNLP